MATACPECGGKMEFESREVRLRSGVCPSCSREVVYLEGETLTSRLPEGAGAGTAAPAGGDLTPNGPECPECGSPRAVRVGARGSLEAFCEECDSVTVFLPRRERGAEGDRPGGPRGFGGEESRGRPCRKCGAPLRFTTNDEGWVVGECESCGNRFTLPPRTGGGGGRGQFGRKEAPRGGARDFRPRGRAGGRDFRRGPNRGDDEERPRRRRPRDY